MKGHVCIELHNHNSGFTERIEQDNMVTNALTYAMGHAVSCGANLSDLMLPVCKRGLGGLFLFDGKLEENAENARISRRLVELDRNAPLPHPVEEFVTRPPEPARLSGFLERNGFRSLQHRLGLSQDGLRDSGPRRPPAALEAPGRRASASCSRTRRR